jgi:quinol monooxygenase YgiN
MAVTKGLFVRAQAQPGKEADVEQLFQDAVAMVEAEPQTTVWFGVRFTPDTFGIFDAFPDEAGRQAHLAGQVVEQLRTRGAELFTAPPAIEQVDVLAEKLP